MDAPLMTRIESLTRLVRAYREHARLLHERRGPCLGRDRAGRDLARPNGNPALGRAALHRNEVTRAAAPGRLPALWSEAHRLAAAGRPGNSLSAA